LPGHTTSKKRKSSVLFGVGEDAAIVAQTIARNQSPHRTAERARLQPRSRGPSLDEEVLTTWNC
jgi:hypothetical protein